MESSHAYFDELCAMRAVRQTSQEENEQLAEHARSCAACRHAIGQYQQIAAQIYAEASLEMDATEADAGVGVAAREQQRVKEALLAQVKGAIHLPLSDGQMRAVRRSGEILAGPGSRMPAWAGWAIAAALLVALIGTSVQSWMTKRQSSEVEARTASLQKEIEEMRGELGRVQTSTRIAGAKTESSPESLDRKRLQTANDSLRKSLESAEEARHKDARELAQLLERVRLLQSSLDVLQASSAGLEAERAGLSEKVSNLTTELRKSQDEIATVSARNEELAQKTLTKVRYVEQQKLLATDHDVSSILGARSLRMIDTYDVSSDGEFERPFGRIFYTEGKSLIFYAFDLDKQKGLKRGAIFQAWGQKGEGKKEDPRTLGVFYMDDPSQNRWVLKVDDSKVLSRIDYVFVTDGVRKEGVRPKGKPLLSTSLNSAANRQ